MLVSFEHYRPISSKQDTNQFVHVAGHAHFCQFFFSFMEGEHMYTFVSILLFTYLVTHLL